MMKRRGDCRPGAVSVAAWTLLLSMSFVLPAFGDDTALIQASGNGNLEEVRALLAKGADVNARNKWGDTALKWASAKGNLGIVRLLKKAGAQ
ncbi:MAG: ankyrin repeat domain-containing protein [Candidatus Entotheonellia bacterium]